MKVTFLAFCDCRETVKDGWENWSTRWSSIRWEGVSLNIPSTY